MKTPLYLVHASSSGYQAKIVSEADLDNAYLLTRWVDLESIDPDERAEALAYLHDDDNWEHAYDSGQGERVKLSMNFEDGWVEVVRLPGLEEIEQYRLQMAGISTAAIGYWHEGQPIHQDYDTLALHDVAKLYKKYDVLYKAMQKLACLGNGDRPGNSQGNEIAQSALIDSLEAGK